MNAQPTKRLIELGLSGMAKVFEEQRGLPDLEVMPFEDRIGLLVDREAAERDTRRHTMRLKFAALRQNACVEDVDLRTRMASISPFSPSSLKVAGSIATRTCSSPAPLAWAIVG